MLLTVPEMEGINDTWPSFYENVPLVEFIYLIHMLGESYRRRLGSFFICSSDFFRALINSLVCIVVAVHKMKQIANSVSVLLIVS